MGRRRPDVTRWEHAPGVWLVAASAALVCFAFTAPADAYSFDAQGRLSFDPNATFTESFEEGYYAPFYVSVAKGDAIDGASFARIECPDGATAMLPISLPSTAAAYRVRAFVRSSANWFASLMVFYSTGAGVPVSAGSLYPTGRMTSDGWVEIESPPVSIDGSRSPSVSISLMSSELDLDALEVVPSGSFVASAPCAVPGAGGCGLGQTCVQGYCQDGVAMVAPLPGATQRNLLVDIFKGKLQTFFGGVYTRQHSMPKALALLESMRNASNAWEFWNTFASAIRTLHDSHTYSYGLPNYVLQGVRAFPICLVEGDADLSHSMVPSDPTYADVIVSHVGPDKNLGLKPGDRIVSVDGQHPIAWAEGLVDRDWSMSSASDPNVHSGAVEGLGAAISALATQIEVIRCDPKSGNCSAPETIMASSFDTDSYETIHPSCDHRPAYHLAANNPDEITHEFQDVHFGLLANTDPEEALYGMIWNDTHWEYGAANPWEAAYTTFRQNAKGLVLDHRRGDGGTAAGAAYLTELSHTPQTAAVYSTQDMLGLFDEPFTSTDGMGLFNMWQNDTRRSYVTGSATPMEDVRIAVLLARDVSGSDFFPFGVKQSPNTRLFGRPTMGAFSTFHVFGLTNYQVWALASGDFIAPSGSPQIGHGVQPDEIVVPTQSDLLAGKDTAYERALAWVRCGKAVCP